jgi:DNA-binding response OmpR family regulator
MKILIIDRDWRFTNQAMTYLESQSHLVRHDSTADEALNHVDAWQPDLVILSDEHAEGGLLENLHARDHRPAILLTGWADRYDRAWRAWQKGGDELLMKPVFKSSELRHAVLSAVEGALTGRRVRTVAASA